MGYEFEGVMYGRLRDMQAARRARYAELLKAGMNSRRPRTRSASPSARARCGATGAPVRPGVTRGHWLIGTLAAWDQNETGRRARGAI